jgi:type IV secretory pathway VirB10-like protein
MTMETSMPQLRRIRWAVRAVLFLGIAASILGNVLHARDNPISQAIAAWPPLALLLTVELISRVPVHRRSLAAARVVAIVVIAGIAAWVSYWHMAGVAARYGETGASPYLLPISVDGLVVVASVCLVELAGRIRDAERPEAATQAEADPEAVAAEQAAAAAASPAAPPQPPDTADDDAAATEPTAGQNVRQDTRTKQEIEAVVRAIKAANPDLSQRRIAAAALTSPSNVRRILGPATDAPVSAPPADADASAEPAAAGMTHTSATLEGVAA